MGKLINLKGQRFGRLVVIDFVEIKNHKTLWLCKCDCGNIKVMSTASLRSFHTQSCGCLQKEIFGSLNRTHNLSGNKCGNHLYALWKSIKYRCYNKKNKSYKNYGGRGIGVCEEWKNDFKKFYDWANANGYKNEKLPNGLNKWTIDRIDNDKDYSPENCRFITNREQAQNKQNSLTYEEKHKICPICGKEYLVKAKNGAKTCSRHCGAIRRNKIRYAKL